MFKKILVPIDVAEPELGGLGVGVAAQIAALDAGQVRLIHVVLDLPFGLGVLLPPDLSKELETKARLSLREMAAKSEMPGGRVSTIVRAGVAYHEVLAEARAWEADLVIVGSRNPSSGPDLLGSNAEKIVRHADCSVLVTRAQIDREGTYWLVPPITS